MRPLRISLVIAAAAAQWACVDEARTETASAHTRDSALVHDLVLAGYDSAVTIPAGRYFGSPMAGGSTVTESSGELADPAPRASATAPARSAAAPTPAAATPTPSGEGFVGPSCASPGADDQRRCLMGYLARSDVQLNKSYQALIDQLKSEAGTRGGSPEPAVVQRLRSTQRNWVVYRDDECRKRTYASEGPLWAPVRARCLEEYSALRQREFDEALAKRKAVAAKSSASSAKSSASSGKSTASSAKSSASKTKARKRTRGAKPKRRGWGG